MKGILILGVLVLAALWYFHWRAPSTGTRSSLDEAAAQAVAQAKAVAVEAKQATVTAAQRATDTIHASEAARDGRATIDRILSGEKLPEKPQQQEEANVRKAGTSAYERILRGESISEAKRP